MPMQRKLTPADIEKAWGIVNYEIELFIATSDIVRKGFSAPAPNAVIQVYVAGNLKDAVVESRLLHTRLLCGIFLSRGDEEDEIHLSKLFPNWKNEPKLERLRNLIDELRPQYGAANSPGSPCWTLNKMLAHATLQRGTSYDYEPILAKIDPIILKILNEIKSLRT